VNRPDEWDRAYAGAALDLPVHPHPVLAAELGGLPPGRGLELGCGEGRPSIWLAGLGWAMTAVDFSAVAVERGRRIAAVHGVEVDWRVADVDAHRPARGLDLALAVYLHPARDVLRAAVGRAAAALAPGGTLLVLGWHRDNAALGLGPRPPEVLYDLDELAAAAPGLRVERAERVPQEGSGTAVDAVLRAVRP
jgi:SAM-dependent methyltransferase